MTDTNVALALRDLADQVSRLVDELATCRAELRWLHEQDDEPDSPAAKLDVALGGPRTRKEGR